LHEIQVMEANKVQWSQIVKLNVGGKKFATSLSTLTKYKDSFLYAMFSGKYSLTKDDKDHVFIDRDGSLFEYILAFIRDYPEWELPAADGALYRRLKREFEYFGLPFEEEQEQETFTKVSLVLVGNTSYYDGDMYRARGYEVTPNKDIVLRAVEIQNTPSISSSRIIILDPLYHMMTSLEHTSTAETNKSRYSGSFLMKKNDKYFVMLTSDYPINYPYITFDNSIRNVDFLSVASKSSGKKDEPFKIISNICHIPMVLEFEN